VTKVTKQPLTARIDKTPKMRPISEACMLELRRAANHEDGRLSPYALKRHRKALERREFIDARDVITPLGWRALSHWPSTPPALPIMIYGEPVACPFCTGTTVYFATGWAGASSIDDPANKADLNEWHCYDCGGRSFWV
jgi:hypothetical protein